MASSPGSSFGKLPHVPFLSLLEIKGVFQKQIQPCPKEYAFVIVDGKLSIEATGASFPQGETDLAKVAQFVQTHFSQLPQTERFLIPKQINFLIQEHNEKGEGFIEELPGPGADLSYSLVLDRLKDPLKKFVGGNTKAEEQFYQSLDENLAKFSRIDTAVYCTIRSSEFTTEQKQKLVCAVESLAELAFRFVVHRTQQLVEAYLQFVWAVPPEKSIY